MTPALITALPTSPDLQSALSSRLERLSKKPLSFWFLNQWLEKEELSRQIAELKEKGFGGFFLHPRGGLEVPYGSEHWFDAIGHCIAEAEKLGMEAWLYDEDPYPSGAAGGEVTLENPGFRAMELTAYRWTVNEPGRCVFDLPSGMLHAAYLIDETGVHRLEGDAGLVRTQWKQGVRSGCYYPPYEETGTPHWRAESHSPHFRIVTEVQRSPARVVAFIRTPAKQNPWGDFPDLLNPEAVDAFTRLTHERYFQRFPAQFGGVIPGIFTDESKLRGNIPWSPHLEPYLKAIGAGTLEELLPHLVLDLGEESIWMRWAFREALARAFLSSFAVRIKRACEQRGLLWTGHFSPEEDPIAQALLVPGLFRLLTHLDLPGTDLIGGNLGSAATPLLHLGPKMASSAAHISGKRFVACEGFAVTDWVQDFEFMTRAVHWLFALGVNRLVTHGQFYSIDGPRKREAPPSQFYQAAGWAHFGAFTQEVERLAEYLSRGRHVAPILLYYSEETYMAEANSPHLQADRQKLGELVHTLLTNGYDFDLIDATHLAKSATAGESGSLLVDEERYHLLLVPGRYLVEAAWEKLETLREQGAEIWMIEQEITILSQPLFRIAGNGGVSIPQLHAICPPLWRADGALIGHQRETKDGPLLFLCNNADVPFTGEVELEFKGPYEVYSGGQWTRTGTTLKLELPVGRGCLIRPAKTRATSLPGLRTAEDWERLKGTSWGIWNATPLGENCLVLDEFLMLTRAATGERPTPLPASAFQSAASVNLMMPGGIVSSGNEARERHFQVYFNWRGPKTRLRLICDTDLLPNDGARWFWLNGHPLPAFTRRFTYDPMNLECSLEDLIQEGRNTLHWVQECREGAALPNDGLRLFGDFHVEQPYTRFSLSDVYKRPENYPCGQPVPPEQIGHRYFPGLMEYRVPVILEQIPERVALRFGKIYESMEVFINGFKAGCIWGNAPLLEFDRSLVHDGCNEVVLRCATSPANYLLGLNRPAGCLGPIELCGLRR